MDLKRGVFISVIIFCGAFLLAGVVSWFRADVFYARGRALADSGHLVRGALVLEKAIGFWKFEPAYHRELAAVYARLAAAYSQEKEDKFIKFASQEAERAYQLNPRNMLTLKSLITTNYALSQLDPRYRERTEFLLGKALERSSTDPTLWYFKGVVYSGFGQDSEAKESLRKALELRPNYPEARRTLQTLTR